MSHPPMTTSRNIDSSKAGSPEMNYMVTVYNYEVKKSLIQYG